MPLLKAAWRQLREFCGFGGEATYLWPRWIVLRAVGIVYVIIFTGILQEGRGIVGPNGLSRVAEYCAFAEEVLPNVSETAETRQVLTRDKGPPLTRVTRLKTRFPAETRQCLTRDRRRPKSGAWPGRCGCSLQVRAIT
jgi:hypothetical protein